MVETHRSPPPQTRGRAGAMWARGPVWAGLNTRGIERKGPRM